LQACFEIISKWRFLVPNVVLVKDNFTTKKHFPASRNRGTSNSALVNGLGIPMWSCPYLDEMAI